MKMYNTCEAVFTANAMEIVEYFDRLRHGDSGVALGLGVFALRATTWQPHERRSPRRLQVENFNGWYSGDVFLASLKPKHTGGRVFPPGQSWTPKLRGVTLLNGTINISKPEISTAKLLNGYELPADGLEVPFNEIGFWAQDYSGTYTSDLVPISSNEREATQYECEEWNDN